jgi:[acyl-carrier-protein] S-malonyltransferase
MASVAFVFAGQGAQYPGMGKELYESSDAARRVFDRAEELRPGTLEMCFNGSAEELSKTINTQPCLFVMDYACAMAAVEAGAVPSCCAGFSLGEVAAACFAGIMDFDQAFRFVIRRAEAMQACAQRTVGAMGAVLRLTAQQVEQICESLPGKAYPVNYNCPGQTVVACQADAFDEVAGKVAEARGRMVKLNLSGAFHSPWMAEATAELAEYLAGQELAQPGLDMYANITAMPYEGDAALLLSRQVSSPVRWQETIERMGESGVDTFVELGAGKTLSGLIRKTLTGAKTLNVEKTADISKLKEELGL